MTVGEHYFLILALLGLGGFFISWLLHNLRDRTRDAQAYDTHRALAEISEEVAQTLAHVRALAIQHERAATNADRHRTLLADELTRALTALGGHGTEMQLQLVDGLREEIRSLRHSLDDAMGRVVPLPRYETPPYTLDDHAIAHIGPLQQPEIAPFDAPEDISEPAKAWERARAVGKAAREAERAAEREETPEPEPHATDFDEIMRLARAQKELL